MMSNRVIYSIRTVRYGLNLYSSKLKCFFSTRFMKLNFVFWGIRLKGQQSFFGKTYLCFHPSSKVKIGINCTFRSSFFSNTIGLKQKCYISAGKNAQLFIGNDCAFSGTVINADKSIIIGNRDFCGANVTICDSDRHPLDAKLRVLNHKGEVGSVRIENDVWLGMNVVVMKGVAIGKGTVIAANSVVVKDIPCNVVAGGIPAVVLKEI